MKSTFPRRSGGIKKNTGSYLKNLASWDGFKDRIQGSDSVASDPAESDSGLGIKDRIQMNRTQMNGIRANRNRVNRIQGSDSHGSDSAESDSGIGFR